MHTTHQSWKAAACIIAPATNTTAPAMVEYFRPRYSDRTAASRIHTSYILWNLVTQPCNKVATTPPCNGLHNYIKHSQCPKDAIRACSIVHICTYTYLSCREHRSGTPGRTQTRLSPVEEGYSRFSQEVGKADNSLCAGQTVAWAHIRWLRNRYFELKNSCGCRPNSNYLLSSVTNQVEGKMR